MFDAGALKTIARYYTYIMYLLVTLMLFGLSTFPVVTKIILWLFFYMVYRSLYKNYILTKRETEFLNMYLPKSEHSKAVYNIFRTILFCIALWGITFATIEQSVPSLKPFGNFLAIGNAMLYGFFYLAKHIVFDRE
jgi:hypothetical protein